MMRRILIAILMLACAWARPAHPHFEHLQVTSRYAAAGGALVSVVDDASAVVINPAGLAQSARFFSVMSTYHKPYGLDDLDEGMVAVSVPNRWGVVGASWVHRGLDGALSENLMTLAFARDLRRTAQDASLSIGASIDFARVTVNGNDYDDAGAIGFGAGVLLRPFAPIGFGYSVRNVTEPTLHLVDGGPGTRLERVHAIGASYYWDRRLAVSVERRRDSDGVWRSHAGADVRLNSNLALRGGWDGRQPTVGAGVNWQAVTVDLGVVSHEYLGTSYVFTLQYKKPIARDRR